MNRPNIKMRMQRTLTRAKTFRGTLQSVGSTRSLSPVVLEEKLQFLQISNNVKVFLRTQKNTKFNPKSANPHNYTPIAQKEHAPTIAPTDQSFRFIQPELVDVQFSPKVTTSWNDRGRNGSDLVRFNQYKVELYKIPKKMDNKLATEAFEDPSVTTRRKSAKHMRFTSSSELDLETLDKKKKKITLLREFNMCHLYNMTHTTKASNLCDLELTFHDTTREFGTGFTAVVFRDLIQEDFDDIYKGLITLLCNMQQIFWKTSEGYLKDLNTTPEKIRNAERTSRILCDLAAITEEEYSESSIKARKLLLQILRMKVPTPETEEDLHAEIEYWERRTEIAIEMLDFHDSSGQVVADVII